MGPLPESVASAGIHDAAGFTPWASLCGAARSRARMLQRNIPVGSAVPIEAVPTREAIVELLAIWAAGAVAVPLHPRWGAEEREEVLRDSGLGQVIPSGRPLAALVRTSGTTGAPRLAALSHAAFEATALASAERLGWRDQDRWLLALPFAHVGGLSVITRCLLAGRTIVLAEDPITAIEEGRCSLASLVPTQLARLVQRNMKAPAGVRAVLIGGAPAGTALLARARDLGWPVRTTYGLTETCAQIATQRSGDPDDTCGPALGGCEIRSVGGALEVRSPGLLDGTVRAGQLETPRLRDGWLITGDLGSVTGGLVRVHGRTADVIVSGGEKVLPGPVEDALSTLLDGAAVCVVGLPDPEWGEVVTAVVVHRNMGLVQRSIQALRGTISTYALPRKVLLVDALPLGAGGKVQRPQVRRLAQEGAIPADSSAVEVRPPAPRSAS